MPLLARGLGPWRLVLGLCGLLALSPCADAQDEPERPARPAAAAAAASSRVATTDGGGRSFALEGAIDPQEYVVGPGDVFSIIIGGRARMSQETTVTADGLLIVPEIGGFRVAGRTLAAVRADVRAALQRRYANVETDAGLAVPRRFAVHVSGAVAVPGRHAVAPVARVEDALAVAMGASPLTVLRTQRAELRPELPALRNVEVRRNGRLVEGVDLMRYYTTGDPLANPYLRDGDVLFVPSYRPAVDAVFVEDRFGQRQAYDYRNGDSVADVVVLARGESGLEGLGSVRIVRTTREGGLATETLSAADLANGRASRVPLQPLDRILLVDRQEDAGRVEVVGSVRYPGLYPVLDGRTTLRDVVEQAGGLRPDALARGAYLERRGPLWDRTPLLTELQALSPDSRAAALEIEGYDATRLSGLSFESRQFLTREILQFQRLSLDVEDALAGTGAPIYLRDGDRLVVPADPGGVFVLGQVGQPGLVPLQPGADADAYIAAAGGRAPEATQVYVRAAGTGVLQPARGATIRSGDYVFVDRSPQAFTESQQGLLLQSQQMDQQERRERTQARYQFVGTVVGVIGTVVSAISVYLLATRDTN